jgi:hypothetical protein
MPGTHLGWACLSSSTQGGRAGCPAACLCFGLKAQPVPSSCSCHHLPKACCDITKPRAAARAPVVPGITCKVGSARKPQVLYYGSAVVIASGSVSQHT